MSHSSRPKKSPRSVRQRKRRGLSRDKLISVAIDLLDEHGVLALTMRALADAVGVTPMALYNHFSSKRALLATVADHVITGARFDGEHADWSDQIRHCFAVLRSLCLRHPWLPGLLEQDGAAPASVFAPMEVTLRALREVGFEELDCMRTYFLLISFTLAQAAYQTRGPIDGLELPEQIRAQRIAGRGYTATERLELPPRWDFDASFAFGLSLMVAGIEAMVSERQPRLP